MLGMAVRVGAWLSLHSLCVSASLTPPYISISACVYIQHFGQMLAWASGTSTGYFVCTKRAWDAVAFTQADAWPC